MGNYKKKKITPAQRRQNMRVSLLMLAGAVIVLILGIILIRSLTQAKEPAEEESSVSRQDSSVMETISIPQIIASDSPAPEHSMAPAGSTKEGSVPERSQEESSQEESSQESNPVHSSEEDSSAGEDSHSTGQWKNVTDDYFRDAAFIGNSLTEGLFFYTDIGDLADGFYSTGLNVSSAQEEAFIEGGYTLEQKLSSKSYGKIYIMMGLNEIGWPDPEVFAEYYADLINLVRRACPGAVIYVQSILPVSAERSAQGDDINNENIREFNGYIQKMAERNGWVYLNVWEAIANDDGVLDADATPDGIHFGTHYMEKWLEYLRHHAVE